jgi:kinesin family protein C1
MGYSRPASAMSRPNSSLSTRKLNGASVPRPATSLDTHSEDGPSVLGKRKGMQIFPSSPSRSFSCPVGNPKVGNLEEPKRSTSWKEARQRVTKEAPGRYADLPNSALPRDTLGLKTNPHLPNPKSFDPKASAPARPARQTRVLIPSPTRSCRTPSYSPGPTPKRPPVPLFLSKDSTIKIFDHPPGAEWNQERKEMDMENVLNQFINKMNEQGQQSSGLKETVDLYKSRSEWIIDRPSMSLLILRRS